MVCGMALFWEFTAFPCVYMGSLKLSSKYLPGTEQLRHHVKKEKKSIKKEVGLQRKRDLGWFIISLLG